MDMAQGKGQEHGLGGSKNRNRDHERGILLKAYSFAATLLFRYVNQEYQGHWKLSFGEQRFWEERLRPLEH